jgi:hypothetical protein
MYEDGVMCDVFQYLEKKALVNGYQPDKVFMQVNGMDDLASTIITYLKAIYTETMKKFGYETGDAVPIAAGYVYLFPTNIKLNETDVSYIYKLLPPEDFEERGFKYGTYKSTAWIRAKSGRQHNVCPNITSLIISKSNSISLFFHGREKLINPLIHDLFGVRECLERW